MTFIVKFIVLKQRTFYIIYIILMKKSQKIVVHLGTFAILVTTLFNYFYSWPTWISWILIIIISVAILGMLLFNNRHKQTDYFCPLGIAILILSLALIIITLLSSYNALTLTTLISIGLGALLIYLLVTSFLKNSTENKIIWAFLLSALLISLIWITTLTTPTSQTAKQIKQIINTSQKEIKAPDGTIFIATRTQSWRNVEVQSGVFKDFQSLEQLQNFINSNYNKIYELYIPGKWVVEIYQTMSGEVEIYYNDALIKTTSDLKQAKQYIYDNILH